MALKQTNVTLTESGRALLDELRDRTQKLHDAIAGAAIGRAAPPVPAGAVVEMALHVLKRDLDAGFESFVVEQTEAIRTRKATPGRVA